MSVHVGMSIEKNCIGLSVFSSEAPNELVYFDAINYDDLAKDSRYKQFGRLYQNSEITKLLTTLSLAILSNVKRQYGEIESVNFSLLKTDVLFSKEMAAIRTEKQGVMKILNRIGVKPTYNTITRFRLWEDLGPDPENRYCIYSGEKITVKNLFDPVFNIDHVVPHSLTRDNSLTNMVICSKKFNSMKSNMTPWEMWSKDEEVWSGIISRARNLPIDRIWRFSKDAVEISQYMKGRDYHMNTVQLNFAASLRYLAIQMGLVKDYNNIDFINTIAISAVKQGIYQRIPEFHAELRDTIAKDERISIVDSIVSYTISKKCQDQILSFADRVDKKAFKEEYNDINFSRHNLRPFNVYSQKENEMSMA